jgi:hypothetical protein
MSMSKTRIQVMRDVRKRMADNKHIGARPLTRHRKRKLLKFYTQLKRAMSRRPPRRLVARLRRIERQYPNPRRRWSAMSPKRYAEYERLTQMMEAYNG